MELKKILSHGLRKQLNINLDENEVDIILASLPPVGDERLEKLRTRLAIRENIFKKRGNRLANYILSEEMKISKDTLLHCFISFLVSTWLFVVYAMDLQNNGVIIVNRELINNSNIAQNGVLGQFIFITLVIIIIYDLIRSIVVDISFWRAKKSVSQKASPAELMAKSELEE